MDSSLFVFSPVYLWTGFAIVVLIVKEILRARGAISPSRHRHHHHHEPHPPAHRHDTRHHHDQHRPHAA